MHLNRAKLPVSPHLFVENMPQGSISSRRRWLIDAYGGSLRHVSNLFDKHFEKDNDRKAAAHMPLAINKTIMQEMQDMFPEEWERTSSHRFRATDDMQYAFSYMYFVRQQRREMDIHRVFRELDRDKDGLLNHDEEDRLVELLLEHLEEG